MVPISMRDKVIAGCILFFAVIGFSQTITLITKMGINLWNEYADNVRDKIRNAVGGRRIEQVG